ncbi:MAG: cell division ATP-binding protein FtsE [Clostridia bacterium]|nr:cell division ATP-binding protein FtsE [Clostridia bacterium]
MIEFKNVTKKYDNKTTALSDVNITIEKGEFVFVVGSSGAGKSTFLKLMMREEVPTSGTITIDGINLNKMRKKKIPYLRRKLGVVFQDFRLIPTMTVFDNVAFAMRVIGTKEKKIRRRVPYLLSLMGLSDKARNYPRELSGGEQQRIALARALANDAEIIIADEPTGNVDPQMSYEIVDLLMRLNEAGTTVIMVTHEHSLVRCFDKRVIILDKGSVVSDGGVLSHEAATSHINPASEISSEYRISPEEDYSVYSSSAENKTAPAEPEDAPEEISEEDFTADFSLDETAAPLAEEAVTEPAPEPAEAAEEPAAEAPAEPAPEAVPEPEAPVQEVPEAVQEAPAEDAPVAESDEAPAEPVSFEDLTLPENLGDEIADSQDISSGGESND